MGTGAALEPNHSHRLLVPGTSWGDEIPWMNAVATLLGADHGSATLVAAGGRITRLDVDASLEHGRPTLLLAGSGGTADAIASADGQCGVAAPADSVWCRGMTIGADLSPR